MNAETGRNRGFEYREQLDRQAHGKRLIEYLARRYTHSSIEVWHERIAAGLVELDGRPGAPADHLYQGQWLCWKRPGWEEPSAPTEFELLYCDDDILAVDKPAGLPTLPGGGFLERTLLHQVRATVAGASPLHRLGRFTSGIVLFSRHPTAHAHLSRQWVARTVEKRYRAWASGHPARDAFTIDTPIGPVAYAPHGTLHAASLTGRASRSHVVVIERCDDAFLCDVFIETGRPHQARIHLAAAGHPLVGDPLYVAGGLPASGSTARVGDPGYALHAAELRIRHPRTDVPLILRTTDQPPQWRNTINVRSSVRGEPA